nr:hypothetical protein [uncultured Carboxylicivirga sp.]
MVIKKLLKRLFRVITNQYYVFGDSHTEVFDFLNKRKSFPLKRYNVTLVGGATAQGMRNPNSKTNALKIFKEKISKLPIESKLIFQLGEVDTGFVIWYRAQKYNESVSSQLYESIDHYINFINNLITKGFRKIILVSAPLPTIKDNQDWGEIANLRKEISATQIDRTKLTIQYNLLLEKCCKEIGIRFINLDNHLLNPDTGIIKDKFLNKDKLNHHLDIKEYSALLQKLF